MGTKSIIKKKFRRLDLVFSVLLTYCLCLYFPRIKASFDLGLYTPQSVSIKDKKIALVLGAGGIRGLSHLGVIEALENHQIPISYIIGSSAGSLVGAFYCSFKDVQKANAIECKTNKLDYPNSIDLKHIERCAVI